MGHNSSEISALVSLLDDTEPIVRDSVIERLVEIGRPAVRALELSWESSGNSLRQLRIENVISEIHKGILRKEVKDWCDCGGDQLLYGAYLIAKLQYPELDYSQLEQKIEVLRSQIWLELNDHLTALEKVRVINHFLFNVHNFSRSIRGPLTPQLFFINHVLDTRKGLPISLAVIYAEIASRLELPVFCVDLPRNFLLCYRDRTFLDDPDGILFYINPYAGGTVLGRPEIEFYLGEQKLEIRKEYLRPCSSMETIERLAEGLRAAYAASGMEEKILFLDEVILILRNGSKDQTR